MEVNRIDIAILMACHNRAETTARCLASLHIASERVGWNVKLFVVDDGSADDTKTAILNSGLDCEVITGPGDWYWAKSMSVAESKVPEGFDAKLWLNDDVEILPDAFEHLEQYRQQYPEAIIVGQQMDPATQAVAFGGKKQLGKFRNKLETVASRGTEDVFSCFSGNFLFVPNSASKAVGPIDGGYSHGYADIDYGLRAAQAGIQIVVPPIIFGICPPKPQSPPSNFRQKLALLTTDPKGTPISSQVRFYKKHGGREWPIYVLYPFFSAILGQNSKGQTRIVGSIKKLLKFSSKN